MRKARLDEFSGGWFIGNFEPTLVGTTDFEVCLKRYKRGVREPEHFQRVSTEVTLVIEGLCRIGTEVLCGNDIIEIAPNESADFEALEDVVLVAVKFPSLPSDKVLGSPGPKHE